MHTSTSLVLGAILLSAMTAIRAASSTESAPIQPPAATSAAEPKQTPPEATSPNLEAIKQTSGEFERAFNAGDAKAVAALWTEDGDYVDALGQTFKGREAIEKLYADFFAANPGSRIQITIDGLKQLGADTILEDGRATLEPIPTGTPAASKYTALHTKSDGKWLMSAVRESRVELPSAYSSLRDLEWLIGSWGAEEHGVQTKVECRWIANKNFIERTYTVTHPDHTSSSGVQLIGWNPQTGQIQSWNFTSDGGQAMCFWTPNANGWTLETVGMLGDGTDTTAINFITPLDDQAYAWRSVQRSAGDVALPDTEEIVLKRVPATP